VQRSLFLPGLIEVHDDVLPDPAGYRAWVLEQRFHDVWYGSQCFKGIAETTDRTLPGVLAELLAPGASVTTSFFRKSPLHQPEPNDVHTDVSMGDWTAILYLNPAPPDEDGTDFWRQRVSTLEWVRWLHVDARFNRLLLFKADQPHARAIFENYGLSDDTARLIHVVFGRGALQGA